MNNITLVLLVVIGILSVITLWKIDKLQAYLHTLERRRGRG